MGGATLPKPFVGNEHQSFFLRGGDHAALLLHGFPGTPAEMLPIGTVLKDAGWTVHGLMLPGLGADIENLDQCTAREWSLATKRTVQQLQRHHSVILLIGYSMGGALALSTASEHRPAGLVLLAPFWSFAERWLGVLWPVLRLFSRRVKPLNRADFSAREVRQGLQRMFGKIDLDDPQIQQSLRRLTMSIRPLEQMRQLGQNAYARLSQIDVPTLVIQGKRDMIVPPVRTRRLIENLVTPVEYHEVDAGHELIDPESEAWEQVKASILLFAASLLEKTSATPQGS